MPYLISGGGVEEVFRPFLGYANKLLCNRFVTRNTVQPQLPMGEERYKPEFQEYETDASIADLFDGKPSGIVLCKSASR